MTALRPSSVLERLQGRPLTARRAGRAVAVVTILVTLVSGVAMWLVDREEFPNIWLGLWWAVQTVTTVGYGDVTPTSPAGRVIAAVIMVSGIGFLTVVTATISAIFIESARRRLQVESEGRVHERLDGIAERLERIERALEKTSGPP